MNGIDRIIERLLGRIGEARACLDKQDAAGAEVVMREVLEEAERAGIRSSNAWWLLAVAHDNQGELEAAFEAIVKAVALDPLEPNVRNSRDVIVRRIGEALARPERADDDPSTPRLYRLLQRAGQVPLGAHLAMVRYHLTDGVVAEARKIADVVTIAFPFEPAAWHAKAKVARWLGDEEAARAAEAQAAVAAPSDAPFGSAGVAEA
ncbi:MAG: hypothetical protein NDI82_03280 [Anaeromyxobacteraceae bacterium]|nr:hypothetical protein [Anaeromyxobacteraceae bacterium]